MDSAKNFLLLKINVKFEHRVNWRYRRMETDMNLAVLNGVKYAG